MEQVDTVVIGAGVVGLAVARALALSGREVLVLDAAEGIGTETSSRNSEVIHAGIYYAQGSLMARFCVAGKHALYTYLRERGLPHANCGKLIVATSPEEADKLESIRGRAAANGVDDLHRIGGNEARQLEPELDCVAALVSPSTGIIDSHAYMVSLQGDAENAGAMFVFHAPALGGRVVTHGIEIDVGGAEPMTLHARLVVNSAGLHAPRFAAHLEGLAPEHVPTAYYAKGNYFSLMGRSPFSRLIYPVPVPGGLGTHLTIDLGGQARFGPDVEWVPGLNYDVDPKRSEGFYAAIRRWWPGLPEGSLAPGYSGIRPKIVPPAVATQDFVVQGRAVHGVPGLINLFGIESPGLTASLAIGDYVAEMAGA
jgi:L-2-hydroxyglutarate oxidase LhgO